MATANSKSKQAEKKDDSYRISEILKRVPNRFLLSISVAKRARQLKEGAPTLLDIEINPETPVITAILEFFADKIKINLSEKDDSQSDILDEISDYLDSEMLDDLNSVIPQDAGKDQSNNATETVNASLDIDPDSKKSIAN